MPRAGVIDGGQQVHGGQEGGAQGREMAVVVRQQEAGDGGADDNVGGEQLDVRPDGDQRLPERPKAGPDRRVRVRNDDRGNVGRRTRRPGYDDGDGEVSKDGAGDKVVYEPMRHRVGLRRRPRRVHGHNVHVARHEDGGPVLQVVVENRDEQVDNDGQQDGSAGRQRMQGDVAAQTLWGARDTRAVRAEVHGVGQPGGGECNGAVRQRPQQQRHVGVHDESVYQCDRAGTVCLGADIVTGIARRGRTSHEQRTRSRI